MTFIVRIFVDEGGAISGVVEQVTSGRKESVHAIADVSRVIAVMVTGEKATGRM
jgi:acyl-CoA reductase-like NAD-dependent aldehyde dehydrogenase